MRGDHPRRTAARSTVSARRRTRVSSPVSRPDDRLGGMGPPVGAAGSTAGVAPVMQHGADPIGRPHCACTYITAVCVLWRTPAQLTPAHSHSQRRAAPTDGQPTFLPGFHQGCESMRPRREGARRVAIREPYTLAPTAAHKDSQRRLTAPARAGGRTRWRFGRTSRAGGTRGLDHGDGTPLVRGHHVSASPSPGAVACRGCGRPTPAPDPAPYHDAITTTFSD